MEVFLFVAHRHLTLHPNSIHTCKHWTVHSVSIDNTIVPLLV